MIKSSKVAAREMLLNGLRQFMIGPFSDDELIDEEAYHRYHSGILAPAGQQPDPEEDEQDTGGGKGDDDGGDDGILVLANIKQQSAMGMTFQVDESCQNVLLNVQWGEYEAVTGGADEKTKWQRKSFNKELSISTVEENVENHYPEPAVRLSCRIRKNNGIIMITVAIVNERSKLRERRTDNNIYQVSLEVKAVDGSPVFVSRHPESYMFDEEFWSYELLYSNLRQFAVGHGCSVQWEESGPHRCKRVWTEWIPGVEVFKASTTVLRGEELLSLDNLYSWDRNRVCDELEKIPDAYLSWVEEQSKTIESKTRMFADTHKFHLEDAAKNNLGECRRAAARIREGINIIRKDDNVWESFRLANEAMAISMRKTRPEQKPEWRAFQLAFILLTLPSAVDGNHPDREILDLLWFPTGGGKTEAYLGLAALVIFYRRLSLKNPSARVGTTVFTRYTLRVLTIQQYERSARMICACEIIRRRNEDDLGKEQITIGLFVGGAATPNRLAEAAGLLEGEQGPLDSGTTTLPLKVCPWCQRELVMAKQYIKSDSLVTPCPDVDCEFQERLPILVVDEEMYKYPPTMIVATVDKFARMAWVPAMRALFGGINEGIPPPSLIIQDELHLIGDALGTVAALYETAIDRLCTHNGRLPKIVGSTATVRRAVQHCRALFNRRAVQFPPDGVDAEDAFFHVVDHETPPRLYAGVHAQGRSPKHTLARIVGTLARLTEMIEDDEARDIFHTMVLYFNSLRELGGALVLAEDDVPKYMDVMPIPAESPMRYLHQIEELNSHVPTSMIPEILERLKTSLLCDDLDREPIDLLLSTNMISVGVDVDRLGLMVVNGQPKTTSEYIQATSRVGRPVDSAGLIVTLYNWTRPRDRSHYERFVAYHRAFYRYVEAASVTPFSARARDRALHGVLISLARLLVEDFAENDSAKQINDVAVREKIMEIVAIIAQRAECVEPMEYKNTEEHLLEIIGEWQTEAKASNRLFWSLYGPLRGRKGLMRAAEVENVARGKWKVLNSMRDVDPPAPVKLMTVKELDKMIKRGAGDA